MMCSASSSASQSVVLYTIPPNSLLFFRITLHGLSRSAHLSPGLLDSKQRSVSLSAFYYQLRKPAARDCFSAS